VPFCTRHYQVLPHCQVLFRYLLSAGHSLPLSTPPFAHVYLLHTAMQSAESAWRHSAGGVSNPAKLDEHATDPVTNSPVLTEFEDDDGTVIDDSEWIEGEDIAPTPAPQTLRTVSSGFPNYLLYIYTSSSHPNGTDHSSRQLRPQSRDQHCRGRHF